MAQQSPSQPSVRSRLPVQPGGITSPNQRTGTEELLASLPVQRDHPDAKKAPLSTRAARIAYPALGSVIGGTLGAAPGIATANPPLAYFGAVVGGGVGAASGELLQTGIERLSALRYGEVDEDARVGLVDRLGRVVNEGIVGEGTGAVIGAAGRLALAPLKSKLEPFAYEAIARYTVRAPDGRRITHILPAQISTSRTLDVSQNITEASFAGGVRVTTARKAGQSAGESNIQFIADELGHVRETDIVGRIVRGVHQGRTLQFRRQRNARWNDFYDLGGDISVPTQQLESTIADILGVPVGRITPNTGGTMARRLQRLYGGDDAAIQALEETVDPAALAARADDLAPRTQPGATVRPPRGVNPQEAARAADVAAGQQRLLGEGAAAVEEVVQPPTARELQEIIAQLGTTQRALASEAIDDLSKRGPLRIVTLLRRAALADMDDALRTSSPAAREAYNDARVFTRRGHARLHPAPILKLLKTLEDRPEVAVQRLLTENNGSLIKLLHTAIGDEAFQSVQARSVFELIKPDAATGKVNWGTLLRKFAELDTNTLDAMFPAGHAREIIEAATLSQRLTEQQAGGIGKMAIQLAQGGAVIGIVSGVLAPGAGMIFVTPWAISKIITSQVGLRWLTIGLRAPAGSSIAARAAGNLLSFMINPLTPEAGAEGATPGEAVAAVAPGTTLRLDPARLGEISGQPGVRTGATVSLPPAPSAPGLIEPGNIDIQARPRIDNPDGSSSSVLAASFGDERGEVLIPTIVNGRQVSFEEAIAHHRRTGEHLGIFKTPAEATAFSQALSESLGR